MHQHRRHSLLKTACACCIVVAPASESRTHHTIGWHQSRNIISPYHQRRNLGWTKPIVTLRGGGDFIEINPDYESDPSESEDETTDASDDESTTVIEQRRRKLRRSRSINTFFRHLHQNQLPFYTVLAIIAFRKEIFNFVIRYNIIPTALDEETGRRRLSIKWSTDGLKLLLVVQLVRLYFLPSKTLKASFVQKDEKKGNETQSTPAEDQDEKASPLIPLLVLLSFLLLFKSSLLSHPLLLPIITSFILRSVRNADPDSLISQILSLGSKEEIAIHSAYVPHLEQHYTFEQVNERYFRDWGAWRKAFPTNCGVLLPKPGDDGSDDKSRKGKMTSLLSSFVHPSQPIAMKGKTSSKSPTLAATYPHSYKNGTVIILDMTKLDTQVSNMQSIRDQISFLIHLVENDDASFFTNGDDAKIVETSEQTQNGAVDPSSSAEGVVVNGNVNCTDTSSCNTTVSNSVLSNATDATKISVTKTSVEKAPKHVEIIILLESPGGAVSSYGLASSHLQRLRSTPGVKLTICIDSVAASGGYMMACMATPGQLLCAPFAMVGSIGVIGQSLNVQKTLEKYGVRPYVFRGGKMKNPVGMVGDVTKEGIGAMQDMVDRIHDAFREHVANAREGALMEALRPLPSSGYYQMGDAQCKEGVMSVIDQVATGDVFLGIQAKKLGLVDRLITSDEYISERIRDGARVLKLMVYQRPVSLSSLLAGHPPPHRNPHMSSTHREGMLHGLLNAIMNRDEPSLVQ
jgi:serine protease SohB